MGLSTSGNSYNILHAITVARALGMLTIGMTGRTGGKMKDRCDVMICVPKDSTPEVQGLHLPIYHALCSMVEDYFYE